MSNWSEREEKGFCSGEVDLKDVSKVCEHLQIPFTVVSFEKEYWTNVFEPMLEQYNSGIATPNPDISCNREIKFKALLEKALTLGGITTRSQVLRPVDYLATGHYAQLLRENDNIQLVQATDTKKDQTYFLMQVY